MSTDLLNSVFLVPILAVGAAAALHATDYLVHGPRLRFYLAFAATLAAMTGVTFARNPIVFLLAWEAMGLASTALVAYEATEKPVQRATWIYFLACHAGACALMLAGVLLQRPDAFLAAFFCGVVGFGLKIGFPPFHVWLPEAHPAAPAPASAVMSGAMIPLGFLGLLRFLHPSFAAGPSVTATCGWTLLALGILGALGGILFAAPQTNLKKLLAFSSVENMGVIAIGFGLSLLIQSQGGGERFGTVAALAFTGAILHILNHAFLKGALFLGAGSVLRQTGTLDQDRLGGLMKRMPFTGTLFTLNALGLAGLPPLNGFLGELLIYVAAFGAVRTGQPVLIAAGFLAFVTLALTGGLAAVTYTKAIGATFLGEPRSARAADATETPPRMYLAQLALFMLSLAMIPASLWIDRKITGGAGGAILLPAAVIGFVLALSTGALVALRHFVCPRGTEKPRVPTWDCGYAEPTARMAYTGTAFTQPVADLFRPILRSRKHLIPFKGHPARPTDAAIATETDDAALTGFWRPFFTAAARAFQRAHLLQNGSLHLYILLILLAVTALLVAAFAS